MQIEVTIGSDGNIAVLTVSTIEDLWHDYQYFRDAATAASSEEPAFEQKRFLRAALVLFVAHCAGVVDSWCRKQLPREAENSEQGENWIRHQCLEVKCKYLSDRANLAGLQVPEFGFKRLRNRIVHATDEKDLEIFRALSPSLLREAETDMTEWLDLIGGTLGYERFLSTRKEVEDSSDLGPITKSVSTEPPTGI